jgi:hypothetical protein
MEWAIALIAVGPGTFLQAIYPDSRPPTRRRDLSSQ